MYKLPSMHPLQEKAVNYLRDLADKIENGEAFIERVEALKTVVDFGCSREEISIHVVTADEETKK
ncbi:hypothetical protein [Escherichia phage BEBK14]|nr:hypothetical protein [Escherichia phage BEBK14]